MLLLAAACFGLSLGQNTDPNVIAGWIKLTRDAVRAEVLGQSPPTPDSKTQAKPVFVTIERDGKILGCRGSLTPRAPTLEEGLVLEARGAAKHDPRYKPVTKKDLDGFLVTITIVDRVEPIDNVDGLKPGDGLVLKSGNRTGVVLPWEGKDPKTRLKWAYQKASVPTGSPAALFRLIADRSRG